MEFLEGSHDRLPEESVNAFLDDLPNLENRLKANLDSKLYLIKRDFVSIKRKLRGKDSNLILPQYIRYQLMGFAEINLDRVRNLFPVDYKIQKHFFLGMAFVLSPIDLASMSEKRFVENKYATEAITRLITGFPFSGDVERLRTHKDLFEKDPSGFKSVDLELETLRGMVTELGLSKEPSTRLTLAGAELGNKMYKALYNSLSN